MDKIREHGFTLLEVMVAFVILALVLGAAYRSISAGNRASVAAGEVLEAISLAESTLARIGGDLPASPGIIDLREGPWRIRLKLTRYRPGDRQAWARLTLEPLRATVTVADAEDAQLASLTTLIIAEAR